MMEGQSFDTERVNVLDRHGREATRPDTIRHVARWQIGER